MIYAYFSVFGVSFDKMTAVELLASDPFENKLLWFSVLAEVFYFIDIVIHMFLEYFDGEQY